MGVLLLTEDDVRRLLTMDMALEAVEQGLRKMGLDEAQNVPRSRVQTDHSMLHTMSASAKSLGVMGAKVYATSRKGPTRFHLSLFDGKTGSLLCLMQADYLGQMRTGAASGVATKYMARPDAAEVGVYGSGKQARTQLLAICKVRHVRQVHVYSPHEERRRQFAEEMSAACQTEVVPTSHPERAAENKDIVITATNSREPVLSGQWLAQRRARQRHRLQLHHQGGAGRGGIPPLRLVVVDSKEQARLEAGDFQQPLEEGVLHWSDVRELGQVVVGRYPGRKQPQDVTLFKSLGIALEDVTTAARVYTRAQAEGVGKTIDW